MGETAEQIIDRAQIVTIKPGDRVLLVMDGARYFTEAEAASWQTLLKERFPAAEFVFVTGVSHVVHEPAELCGHCHDDPPVGHTCPKCGRLAEPVEPRDGTP